jgi:hypothetical protein
MQSPYPRISFFRFYKILIIQACLVINACSFLSPSYEKDDLFNSIENKYGIEVLMSDDPGFFPKEWLLPPISAKSSGLSEKQAIRFPSLLEKALSSYPFKVISKNLNGIALSKSLGFYDIKYGGTNSTSMVYLTSKGKSFGYSDSYLISIFHHEFSSILLRNYPFPRKKWLSSNPDNFEYKYENQGKSAGVEAIKHEKELLTGSDELYQKGFLTQYSVSGFEEDFNMYSATILTNPKEFKAQMNKYEAIRRKFNIWLDFYNSIDDSFTNTSIFGQ